MGATQSATPTAPGAAKPPEITVSSAGVLANPATKLVRWEDPGSLHAPPDADHAGQRAIRSQA
jgi:hypothetical protein